MFKLVTIIIIISIQVPRTVLREINQQQKEVKLRIPTEGLLVCYIAAIMGH